MPRSWSRCWTRSTMRSTSSPPMVRTMALQPMRLCYVTVQARGSSFHRARTRLNGPAPKRPASETTTLHPCRWMAGLNGRQLPATANELWLKLQWVDTKVSSGHVCVLAHSSLNRQRLRSAWPYLTECSPADARNPFVAKHRREQPNKRTHQRTSSAYWLIRAPTPRGAEAPDT